MLAAITVLLAIAAVTTACWFALSALEGGFLGVHHFQWLILSILLAVALPSLSWDRAVFAELLTAFQIDGSGCLAAWVAWGCTAAAAALLLNPRLIRRVFGAALQESECN